MKIASIMIILSASFMPMAELGGLIGVAPVLAAPPPLKPMFNKTATQTSTKSTALPMRKPGTGSPNPRVWQSSTTTRTLARPGSGGAGRSSKPAFNTAAGSNLSTSFKKAVGKPTAQPMRFPGRPFNHPRPR